MAEVRRLRRSALEWRLVEGEVVALDLQRSEYLLVNRTGAMLWELLVAGASAAEMAESLVGRYRLDESLVRTDVDAFLAALSARHLLETGVSTYDVGSLRAAWWTLRALHRARRSLGRPDFGADRIPAPPRVPSGARHAVVGVLRRRPQSCLVRALVLQRWDAAQGDRRDLVVGVTPPGRGFVAHAWLDGDPVSPGAGFVELARHSAPGGGSTAGVSSR